MSINISTQLCCLALPRAALPNAVAASIFGVTSNKFTLAAWTSSGGSGIPVDYYIAGK